MYHCSAVASFLLLMTNSGTHCVLYVFAAEEAAQGLKESIKNENADRCSWKYDSSRKRVQFSVETCLGTSDAAAGIGL